MATELPDCRLRYPAPPIDFAAEVGLTGQLHDDYPAPGQQPRYDWLRMTLIGLLANQASYEEPTQYRDGTLWFDLNTLTLKIRTGGTWASLAGAIELARDGDASITLADVYEVLRTGTRPQAIFSGVVQSEAADTIPIPPALRVAAGTGNQPLVWCRGNLLDPRLCSFLGGQAPTAVKLTGAELLRGDTFTVLLANIGLGLSPVFDVVI